MKLENKTFTIENAKNITVEKIEALITSKNYKPLRWAIVKTEHNTVTIEASCINCVK